MLFVRSPQGFQEQTSTGNLTSCDRLSHLSGKDTSLFLSRLRSVNPVRLQRPSGISRRLLLSTFKKTKGVGQRANIPYSKIGASMQDHLPTALEGLCYLHDFLCEARAGKNAYPIATFGGRPNPFPNQEQPGTPTFIDSTCRHVSTSDARR